jgi:two-component system OmpR family sensor kinase
MLAMAGVLALAIAAVLATAILVTTSTLWTTLDDALAREAAAFEAAIAGSPAGQPLIDATRAYLKERQTEGAGLDPILLVTFPEGRTISNSDIRIEDATGLADPASQSGAGRYATIEAGTETYRVLSVSLRSRGTDAGVFRAALSTAAIRSTGQDLALDVAAAGLLALALGVPLSYLATRRALRPLARMAADAEAISKPGSMRSIAYEGPSDELGALARALNEMLARLEQSANDQRAFVADASHELRTPVAVIRGNAELLRTGVIHGEDTVDALQRIESESERMSKLLNELLALARLEATGQARLQPLCARVLLDEVAARGRALGRHRISVEGSCDVWVSGDPDLLDQALVNLMRNAIAHTPDEGSIRLTCARSDDSVLLTVTDDGPGIAESEIDRIFDRFRRAGETKRDDDTGGAGLGLAITRRLIELHEGTIQAENVEPHGARFTISLPAIPPPDDEAYC